MYFSSSFFYVCTIKRAQLTTRPKCCQNYCFLHIFNDIYVRMPMFCMCSGTRMCVCTRRVFFSLVSHSQYTLLVLSDSILCMIIPFFFLAWKSQLRSICASVRNCECMWEHMCCHCWVSCIQCDEISFFLVFFFLGTFKPRM